MSRRVSALVLLGFAVTSVAAPSLPPAPAKAAPDVRLTGPIKITAERAELERREYALYRGRVKLVSQDMVLTGDRLELRQPAKGKFEARLTGTPARLDHPGDAKGPPVSASAAQIVYDTGSATVELSGGVQLARGTDQLTSSQVLYNLAARRITANSGGEGQVQITITPPSPKEEATPAPPPRRVNPIGRPR